jgi:hypothetical protein
MTSKRAPKIVKYCPNPDCVARIQLRAWMDIDGDKKCAACNKRMYREFLDEKPTPEFGTSYVATEEYKTHQAARNAELRHQLDTTDIATGPDPVAARERMLAGRLTTSQGFGGKQVGGIHYGASESDVFAFCEANGIGMVAGTGIKYLARLGKKGERPQWVLDARKGIQCIERRCLDLGITLEELYGE